MFNFFRRIPGVFALYFLIGLARVSQTLDKLPADPGFDRLREVRTDGIRGVFSQSLGYLDISAHVGPLLSTLFGLRHSAIILTLTTVIFTALLALLIYCAVHAEIGSQLFAVICGALLMLVPAAAESTLGNHGSLKWPLMTALCVVVGAQYFSLRHKYVFVSLIVITGFSNPFTFIALIGWAIRVSKNRKVESSNDKIIGFCIAFTTVIQFLVWRSSGNGSQIYGSATFIPWNGMGLFWWWIWCSPVAMSVAVLLYTAMIWRNRAEEVMFASSLALSSLALWILMYWEAGIKDSTAVATCTLSSISLLLAIRSIRPVGLQRFLFISAVGSFALLSIPWFSSGSYLAETPNWSIEISRLESDCEDLNVQGGEVLIQTTHVEFTCAEIGDWG